MIELIIITVLNCFLWVALTFIFKNIIKKMWLFTLFPLAIYTVASLVVISRVGEYLFLIPLGLLNLYYLLSLVKGFKLTDTLLIPTLSYIILTTLILSTKHGV